MLIVSTTEYEELVLSDLELLISTEYNSIFVLNSEWNSLIINS